MGAAGSAPPPAPRPAPSIALPLALSHGPRGQGLTSDTPDTTSADFGEGLRGGGRPLWCPGMPRSASYTPAGSANSAAPAAPRPCHHRAALADTPHSIIPLAGHKRCFSSSLPPPLPSSGCSPSKAGCPGALPPPQLSTSAALTSASLPLFPRPALLARRTGGCWSNAHKMALQSQSPPRWAALPESLRGPLPPDSSFSLLQESPDSSCPPLPLPPARDLTCASQKRRRPSEEIASVFCGCLKLTHTFPFSPLRPGVPRRFGPPWGSVLLPSGLPVLSPPLSLVSCYNGFLSYQITSFLLSLSVLVYKYIQDPTAL